MVPLNCIALYRELFLLFPALIINSGQNIACQYNAMQTNSTTTTKMTFQLKIVVLVGWLYCLGLTSLTFCVLFGKKNHNTHRQCIQDL